MHSTDMSNATIAWRYESYATGDVPSEDLEDINRWLDAFAEDFNTSSRVTLTTPTLVQRRKADWQQQQRRREDWATCAEAVEGALEALSMGGGD